MILPVKEVNNIFIITFFLWLFNRSYDTYQMNKYIYYTALTLIQKYL